MMPLAGPVLTTQQMREAELSSGVPLEELMERAGAAVAEAAWRLSGGAPILILCGPGNNGGDGYVAARLLAQQGAIVSVASDMPPVTALARAAHSRWTGPTSALAAAGSAPVVVDALFGTGLSRPLDTAITASLLALRGGARLMLAVDVPSGVGSDDGADLSAVGADVTLALGFAKPAHLLQPAAILCGRVVVADLGIDAASDANVLVRPRFEPPGSADHKYRRGLVVIVAGDMPGAAALAASAAARSGAGYVVVAGTAGRCPRSVVQRPIGDLDQILADPRVGAVVVGPGLGKRNVGLVQRVVRTGHAVVVDGDALQPGLSVRDAPTILTPHAGEFARTFGELQGSKLDRTRLAAQASGATVMFKGSDTVIASPTGVATLAPPASSWLSTAGTGDVLAGVTGAMLARGLGAHEAAEAAVWLHGEAARRAGPALIADDLLRTLPSALAAALR